MAKSRLILICGLPAAAGAAQNPRGKDAILPFMRTLWILLGLGAGSAALAGSGPARPRALGALPIRCEAFVSGRKALDLTRPAARPYSLPVPGRKLEIAFTLSGDRLGIEVFDRARSVKRGSWTGAAPIARAQAVVARGKNLELALGEPEIRARCRRL